MSQEPNDLWAQCLLALEQRLRPQTFNTWFRPTRAWHFDAQEVTIEVPSSYFAEWLETRYLDLIREVILHVTQLAPPVTFVVAQAQAPPDTTPPPISAAALPAATRATAPEAGRTLGPPPAAPPTVQVPAATPFSALNQRYTFETFVIGEGNRFAHAAAQAVAQAPGKTQFNPLVIYGGVGLGKTHLLQAIGHHAQQHNLAQRVAFVPSEKFMSDFIEALKTRSMAEFRNLYRNPDILLIDDIQFILKGEATQDEFFHTFNALHQSGRQIVMTCDSPPGQLAGMEERLVSRFQWGLVTPIEPPDLETRIAILHQKAEINAIPLPEEVAVFLGNYISSNIRELEGALIHLMAYCSVNQTELTLEAARQIVQERIPSQSEELTIEFIQQRVADHFGLTVELLMSKTRKQAVAQARQVAMYLAKRLTQNSLKVIGLHFGNRDHSTVVHAIKTVSARCATDHRYTRTVEALEDALRPQTSTAHGS
jgi:chromosomal replication initiator protein